MARRGAFGHQHFAQPFSGVGGLGDAAPLQPRLRRLRGGLGDATTAPLALTWEAARALYDEVTRREQNPPPLRVETDVADCVPYWGLDVYSSADCSNIAGLIYADLWMQAKASLAALVSRADVIESGWTKGQSRQRYYNTVRILIETMVRSANMRFIVTGGSVSVPNSDGSVSFRAAHMGDTIIDQEMTLPFADGSGHFSQAPHYKVMAPPMLPNFSMSFMTGSGCSGHHSSGMPEGGLYDPYKDWADPGGNDIGSGLTYYRMWMWRRDKCPVDNTPSNGLFVNTLSNLAYGNAFPGTAEAAMASTPERAAILVSEITPGMAHAPDVLRGTRIPDVMEMDTTAAVPFMQKDPEAGWSDHRVATTCDTGSGCVWRMPGESGRAMTGKTLVMLAAGAAQRWSGMNLLQYIIDATTNYLSYYTAFVEAGLVGAPDTAVVNAQKSIIQAHRDSDEALVFGVYGGVAAAVNVLPVVGQALSILMAVGAGIAKALIAFFAAIINHNYPCPAPMNLRIYDTCGINPNAAQGGASAGVSITTAFTQLVKATADAQVRAAGHTSLFANIQGKPAPSKLPWIIGGGVALGLGALLFRKLRKRKG